MTSNQTRRRLFLLANWPLATTVRLSVFTYHIGWGKKFMAPNVQWTSLNWVHTFKGHEGLLGLEWIKSTWEEVGYYKWHQSQSSTMMWDSIYVAPQFRET